MYEVGRLCIKLVGRDANRKCVIVDRIDGNFVLIDGMTRRRKCNVRHLEPLKETMKISKGASHAVVVSEFKKLKLEIKEKKPKEKKERPRKQKKKKAPKLVKEKKQEKKAEEKQKYAEKQEPKKEAKPALTAKRETVKKNRIIS